jgi:mono/diheme cytochrome c family protein
LSPPLRPSSKGGGATSSLSGKKQEKDMVRFASICFVAAVSVAGSASAQSPVERGKYLVNGIGACSNCHTPRGQGGVLALDKLLSGGPQTFNSPAATVKGSNLTPDPDTGIGKLSAADIKREITQGKRPDGQQLAANMPSAAYGVMTASDQDAVVAYLKSIPPIKNEVAKPIYKGEIKVTPFPPAEKPFTDADLRDPQKHGVYLAALGHCVVCHSRESADGSLDYKTGLGGGGRKFGAQGAVIAANLTSKGVASWSDAEIKRALTEGVSRDGRKLNAPMVDFAQYYKTMTDADLSALIGWMRSLAPIE